MIDLSTGPCTSLAAMLIDSHCHLDFPALSAKLPELLATMQQNRVSHALCISVRLPDFPRVLALAEAHDNLYATVGVHPDYVPGSTAAEGTDESDTAGEEPSLERLLSLAAHPKVLGIGETGLDYFRLTGDLEWQRERFRVHIRAARACGKPLIVHTRAASNDTIRVLREEDARAVGGVMHCFTEPWDVAEQALAENFYISLSGIVTFKNAKEVHEVARRVPLDRLLVETDSPYLAPAPHRGKQNQPGYVRHVAEHIAQLRGVDVAEIEEATTANFWRLFGSKSNALKPLSY